ncbi:MAG: TolC family protein [Bacteroidaceae bacterium]|nr:TolC family protein [Bacteroidaceae bacterium]
MSKIGKEMAASNVRLTESQVIVNTTEAYLLAVKAKQLTEVARSYKALLDELQKNVDAAVKHGLKTRNDALKVQVKRNEVELNIQKADNAYRLACMNLCQVTGLDLNSNISVDENSVKETGIGSDAKALSQASIESRPEFSILSNKTKLAQKKVKLVQSDYLPTVAAIGSYSYLDGMELAGKKLFKGNGAFSVGVTVKIPVIGYLTEGVHKTRSARAEQRIAQLEQEELNEKMTLELTQCANNYSESVLEMDITRKSTIQAEENLKMSKQQYEVGLEPLSDYLEAQALWQSAKANEIEARYQNQLAYMKYLKAKGEL